MSRELLFVHRYGHYVDDIDVVFLYVMLYRIAIHSERTERSICSEGFLAMSDFETNVKLNRCKVMISNAAYIQ